MPKKCPNQTGDGNEFASSDERLSGGIIVRLRRATRDMSRFNTIAHVSKHVPPLPRISMLPRFLLSNLRIHFRGCAHPQPNQNDNINTEMVGGGG